MSDWDRLKAELAREFDRLYESAKAGGASERSLARQLKSDESSWSQTKINRIRNGEVLPTPEDALTLALAMGADQQRAAQLEDLAQLVEDERPEVTPSKTILDRGGSANFQRKLGRVERRAADVRTFHPLFVHGQLQTEAYMLAISAAATGLDPDHPDTIAWLAARRHNQTAGLAKDVPTYTHVMAEAALWTPLLSGPAMAEQIDHITRVADEHPKVQIGVIPLGRAPVGRPVYALHGFDVYFDEHNQATGVVYGTHSGTAFIKDVDELAKYRDLLERHHAIAEFGEGGRELLARAAARHREAAM